MSYTTIIPSSNDGQLRRGSTLAIPQGATQVLQIVVMDQTDAANPALAAQGTILFSWDGGITWQDTLPPGDVRRYDNGNDLLIAQSWQWQGGGINPHTGLYATPSLGLGIPVDANQVPANAVTGTLDTRGTSFSGPTGLQCNPNAA